MPAHALGAARGGTRSNSAAAVLGGKLYTLGGHRSGIGTLASVEAFDPQTDRLMGGGGADEQEVAEGDRCGGGRQALRDRRLC